MVQVWVDLLQPLQLPGLVAMLLYSRLPLNWEKYVVSSRRCSSLDIMSSLQHQWLGWMAYEEQKRLK